jgi:hypothetical protein
LPKIGPPKRKGFFEEYFYQGLAALFVAVAILGAAGGLSGSDAMLWAAWVTGAAWFGRRLKDYFLDKAKKVEDKKAAAAPPPPPADATKGSLQLPPGMKPMIGPQWPVKAGPFPTRPGLKTAPSIPPTKGQNGSGATPKDEASATPKGPDKPGFTYQRPTLPDRKAKLPYNWPGRKDKKPKR